jgi:hypothetical protein
MEAADVIENDGGWELNTESRYDLDDGDLNSIFCDYFDTSVDYNFELLGVWNWLAFLIGVKVS